jgi:outer membrane protein OmpA-like peptidoglycan-associated protein
VLADDCRGVPNILVLFDASGFMKEKDRYEFLLKQMSFFEKAMPITADGFFNVGLRHYGLKVGMGCDNTESILAVQPWDPQRFIHAFPKSVSYGVSSLSAGLRAAADDVSGLQGKSVIVVVGGGIESCKVDPVKIAEQISVNNPDLQIHTFQIGNAQDGSYFLRGIAEKGRGTYTNADLINSPAEWHAWMRRFLVVPCPRSMGPAAQVMPQVPLNVVTFDLNSTSVTSADPSANSANFAAIDSAIREFRSSPMAQIELHGYSDGRGRPEYNLKLSRQRAEAVAAYLAKKYGIPSSRIKIIPHGAVQQDAPLPDGASERYGRRVVIEIRK